MLLAFRHKVFVNNELEGILSIDKQLTGILIGGTVIFILGLFDDKKSVPPVVKFNSDNSGVVRHKLWR